MDLYKKYKLLTIRSKFLKQSLEVTSQIFDKATIDFMAEVSKQTHQKTSKDNTTKGETPVDSKVYHGETDYSDGDISPSSKEHKNENLRKVFKKIAIKIHPDKLVGKSEFEREYKNILFEKARQSFEINDYHGILEVAEELNIEFPPPTQDQIEMLKQTNSDLEIEINVIKKSIVWNWYHGDEQAKDLLMKKYIEAVKKSNSSGS